MSKVNSDSAQSEDESFAQKAEEAAEKLPAEVVELQLELGQARLAAQQAASTSLQARFPQTVAFQFGAAAFCMTQASQTGPGAMAVAASLAFLVGGWIAFSGVKSDFHHLPGVEPSWWHRAVGDSEFDLTGARSWLAGCTEDMIRFNNRENDRRGQTLNRSLGIGAFGASLLAAALGARLLGLP